MNLEKDKETIYVKNIVDYSDYRPNQCSSNSIKKFSDDGSLELNSDSNLASIDEKIINILNFEEYLNGLEGESIASGFDEESDGIDAGSFGSGFDEGCDDSVDELDEADFDDELEFICSLGLDPKKDELSGVEKDSLADYYNPEFQNNPDEVSFLSFFDDFVLVEMGFDDMVREIYFEE